MVLNAESWKFNCGAVWAVHCIAAFALAVCLLAPSSAVAQIEGRGLAAFHQWIKLRHRNVQHMSADEFVALKEKAGDKVLVIDVREPAEHAVSMIKGAIRVSPEIKTAEFLKTFADRLKGRTVVLYCSVGARSSSLASRVQKSARSKGVAAFYNLSGGIFNWHNQSRQLDNEFGVTDLVHPYSSKWSKLLSRRDKTSYQPERPKQEN